MRAAPLRFPADFPDFAKKARPANRAGVPRKTAREKGLTIFENNVKIYV